jgi:hypothetical protein
MVPVHSPYHDEIRENLLIEGLQDRIHLRWVHGRFSGRADGHVPPLPEVQEQTLNMIRELVSDGLFVLGSANGTYRRPRFTPWDLPLDDAMARIEKAYVEHFDDQNWMFMCWLDLTEKGEKLAQEIYYAAEDERERQHLLIEGLQNRISLGDVHRDMFGQENRIAPSLQRAQRRTLDTIRELVGEGLFVLGVPSRSAADPEGFTPWDLSLDTAIAKIEDTYVTHFDDKDKWTGMVWLKLTEKGKKLALELDHAHQADP